MSTARLAGGWVLLCGLSAGGTYFAIDEADRRFDLKKYDLRAKMGLNSAPSPSPAPSPAPTPAPTPPVVGGGSTPAPTVDPPPQPVPDPRRYPSGGGSAPVQPVVGGGNSVPAPAPAPGPLAGGRRPTGGSGYLPVGGGRGGVQTPNPVGGGGQSPVTPNPSTPNPTPNPSPPVQPPPRTPPVQPAPDPNVGQVARPDPKNTDQWRGLRAQFDQMAPRSDAVINYLEQMRRQTVAGGGVFRTDLQTAMFTLKDAMNSARRALDAGDTDTARGYLATAYQQLMYLEQNRR